MISDSKMRSLLNIKTNQTPQYAINAHNWSVKQVKMYRKLLWHTQHCPSFSLLSGNDNNIMCYIFVKSKYPIQYVNCTLLVHICWCCVRMTYRDLSLSTWQKDIHSVPLIWLWNKAAFTIDIFLLQRALVEAPSLPIWKEKLIHMTCTL